MFKGQAEQSISTTKHIIYCRKSSESDERQVQSLSDQINMLVPFIIQRGLQIAGQPLQESKSAKAPGRPVFDSMIQMIERGLANGIVILNPSRLSRNTVDTGRIIFLMDQGKLEEVVTPSQTFKNNPSDKFILNLLCSQAKLENDNKSVVVKDSLTLKAERGDFPGKARAGYMNNHHKNQGERDISAHPIYFPLMRKLIDLALTGNYSVEDLCKKAEEMGIRNFNGKVIGKSSLHRYLRDPFYTGKFRFRGKLLQGNHPALMTEDEFNLLQNILDGKGKPRKQCHMESVLGDLMKCGECHYGITAEYKTKHYKNGTSQTFAYYRCTKKSKTIKCAQPYVSQSKLESEVLDELSKFELDPDFAKWAFETLDEMKYKEENTNQDSLKALQNALDGVIKKINNLLELKISPNNMDGSLLTDEEYSERKQAYLQEKMKITEQLSKLNGNEGGWVDVARDSFDFALQAAIKFKNGAPDIKRTIVKTVGSDLILLYQDLQFRPRFLFLKYKEGIEKTKSEINRLGPSISQIQQTNLEYFVKNSIWYPGCTLF